MKQNQKLADLVQGIEGLLSKGRCPLTGEDEALLKSCIAELKGLNNKSDWVSTMERVTKWLLLFLEVHDKLKDVWEDWKRFDITKVDAFNSGFDEYERFISAMREWVKDRVII